MPLYEYHCPTCRKPFEALRPMSRAAEAATCPAGHRGAARTVSLVAARAWGGDGATAGQSGGGCGGCAGGACACGH